MFLFSHLNNFFESIKYFYPGKYKYLVINVTSCGLIRVDTLLEVLGKLPEFTLIITS